MWCSCKCLKGTVPHSSTVLPVNSLKHASRTHLGNSTALHSTRCNVRCRHIDVALSHSIFSIFLHCSPESFCYPCYPSARILLMLLLQLATTKQLQRSRQCTSS